MKVNEQDRLKSKILNLIRESLEGFGGEYAFEQTGDDEQEKIEDNPDGKADIHDETEEQQQKRAEVEDFFLNRGVDIAPYAYKLYAVEVRDGEDTNDMKNARGKFTKCLKHRPNSKGYPYSFSSVEINKLANMISGGLNESRRVVRLTESTLRQIVSESIQSVLKDLGK